MFTFKSFVFREIQGDECASILNSPLSTPNQALSRENKTIDEILAILDPRVLDPIPGDGWSPTMSLTPTFSREHLEPIPEQLELEPLNRVSGSQLQKSNLQNDSFSGSSLLDLLQGGVTTPKPASNRRVTWCGGGAIPYSGQNLPHIRPRSYSKDT